MFNFKSTYQTLPKCFYSFVEPYMFQNPKLLLLNKDLAGQLNIDESYLDLEGHLWLSSNKIGQKPIAQAYAGHQFGHFTLLGDGRAMLLGELETKDGLVDLQLKGSGPTQYSRRGDGNATLSSMLREYLISESMYALNIPTTRSLALVTTGETVIREQIHDGAILTRVAKAHIRVGSFQYALTQGHIKTYTDYTINRLYPKLSYLEFLETVIKSQADLIARWQSVGFIHGVMNTDNMSIAGETIDYGPCAFIDTYNPKTVFSSIDHQGRYAYDRQADIALWNLSRFAETLLSLLDDDEEKSILIAETALKHFYDDYQESYLKYFSRKLGLKKPVKEDIILIDNLLEIMKEEKLDFTNTFIHLLENELPYLKEWKTLWFKRLKMDQTLEEAKNIMLEANPQIIPRNHLVEMVLDYAVKGDLEPFIDFHRALKHPFEKAKQKYTLPGPTHSVYQTFCGT